MQVWLIMVSNAVLDNSIVTLVAKTFGTMADNLKMPLDGRKKAARIYVGTMLLSRHLNGIRWSWT